MRLWPLLALQLLACGDPDKLGPSPIPILPDAAETLPDASAPDAGIPDVGGTIIIPLPAEHLRVTLVWDIDNDQTTDMDLHLLRPGGLGWGQPDWDCHFGTPRPDWGGADASPVLDVDDTNGHGPENITILAPAPTVSAYRVGVHAYGPEVRGQHWVSQVYIQIFCKGAVSQYGPIDLSRKQLWSAADVLVGERSCIIVPIQKPDGSLDISTLQ